MSAQVKPSHKEYILDNRIVISWPLYQGYIQLLLQSKHYHIQMRKENSFKAKLISKLPPMPRQDLHSG